MALARSAKMAPRMAPALSGANALWMKVRLCSSCLSSESSEVRMLLLDVSGIEV